MQIATFLEEAREQILDAAIDFARTIPALHETGDKTLRDHLPSVLETISADLRRPQSRTEAIAKSHGEAPPPAAQTSAQTHGLLRAQIGITVEQLVAEFRALRSSVLRLWGEAYPPGPGAMEDVIRFNEAIDQAVAESVQFFSQERERWRHIFLGVLGHDLRAPLNAIALTVEMLREQPACSPAHTALLGRGVKRMTSLLDSLLEYNRASLGTGMVLHRAPTDLAAVCAEEIELLEAANPAANIRFETHGSAEAAVDASRVREALANLVSNAIKHGDPSQPCVVRVEGGAEDVNISVENGGEIPEEEIEMLFEPLRQRKTGSPSRERTHLGLGLFIARQIAKAHGEDAKGSSSAGRVRFTVRLPKTAPAEDAAA